MRPDSLIPLVTGPIGALFTALGAVVETSQFGTVLGVLLGLVAAVLLALVASLLGWAIVVLLARSTYIFNPRVSPAADSVYDAEPVGITSFFSFAALGSVLGGAASSVSSQVSAVASAIASNLLFIAIIVLLFTFIFVWDAWHHLFIHAFAQFEANFFLGFWRSTAVPLSAIVAFVADMLAVVLDGVRHFVQAGTVVTIEKSLICGFGTLQVLGLQAFATFNETIIDTEQWLRTGPTPDQTALTRGPNFFPAAADLGQTIASTQTLLDCACQPLADRLFAPLALPFTQPAFANAINATLGILPAFATQVIFRPIVTSIQRARTDPAMNLSIDVVPPSFNATLDLLAYAITNATLFTDSFIPALQNTTTLFIQDLIGVPLPLVLAPRAGPLTATIGGLADVTIQVVKDVLNLISNAIFNSDQVFAADGFLFWRFDDAFEAAKRAILVVEGYLSFFAAWLRDLGDILAANVRKRSEFVAVRALAHLPQSAVGDALRTGFDLVATFIDTANCYVDSLLVQFAIPLGQLIVDLPVGTVYRAVSTTIAGGFPNPLRFAQELWGDFTPQRLVCGRGLSDLFNGTVSGCLQTQRFVRLCAGITNDTTVRADLARNGFTIDAGFDLFEMQCLESHVGTCGVGGTATLAGTNELPPVDNVFVDVLDGILTTSSCTSELFDNLCTGCGIFGVFLGRPLVNVLVQVFILPLNILIHIDLVVTTEYLGTCVDFDTPLNAIEAFFTDVGLAIDEFNTQLTGTACPAQTLDTTTVDVDSATFLCALGGVVQFGGATVVELVRQVTVAFRIVIVGITALAGASDSEEFLNILGQLSFAATLANAEVAILDATALLLSIFIPASFQCQPSPGVAPSNVRTAFVNALGTLAADALLLIPRVVLTGLTTVITDLTTNVADGVAATAVNVVGDLFAAVFTPILTFLGDAFIQFGNVLNCLTAANSISSVFTAIGTFLQSPGLIKGIQLVVELFTDVIAFVFGVVQAVVTGDTTLLGDSLDLFTTLAGDLFILIFGISTACGIQSFICAIPFIGNVTFITAQCAAQGHPTSCASTIQSSSGTCAADIILCASPAVPFGGACPSSPFGCCSTIPGFPAAGSFPTINDAAFSTCQTGQFCDERATCIWNLPVDANNVATIPFEPIAPAGDPDAALGQSVRDALFRNCPRFSNLTDCINPGLLNSDGTPFSHGEIVRARPFGLHMALGAPGTGQLLNFDYCMRVVDAYGRARADALLAPLRHLNGRMVAHMMPDLLAQLRATPALVDLTRCYFGLYPETAARAPSFEDMYVKRAAVSAAAAVETDSLTTRATAFLVDLHQRGSAIYERNRRRVTTQSSRARITPLQRNARFSSTNMQLASKFRIGRASLANTLANVGLSHDAEQRVRERKLTRSFFQSFGDWFRERGRRRQYTAAAVGGSDESALAPQLVALLLHFCDAAEHMGYALHYHLNLRPANVDVFGGRVKSHTEQMLELSHTFSHSALTPARPDELADVPHPLEVLRLWAVERREYAAQRLNEKIDRVRTSADYVAPPPLPVRWHQVVYVRQTTALKLARSMHTTSIAHAAATRDYRTFAVLPNDTALEELLGVDQCNTGEQLFCTGCALLDNLVFAVEQQVNASIDFYTNDTGGGFGAVETQFETTIHNTLIDPVGPDTYTTANPRTPFILRRFLTIDWPWFWDYSELRAIVYGANDTADTAAENSAVGFSAREQAAIAASQNRTDVDLATLNATSIFVTPIISFLERLAFRITQIGPVDTLIRLFERYIVCDYVKSMFGAEPHSTGLFDAIVITTLGLFVIGVFLSIIPGVGMCAMMIYMMFGAMIYWALVFWIGYGASPLCTLPSFFGGIPGVPVPFPTDLQRLFEELTPECPPVNPGMIDPAAFAAASTQLCGEPGDVPPLVPCSEAAGFIDGFDNIFFSLTGLYGEGVTMQAAAELAPFAPDVADVARIYTDAHNDALAARFEVGALCNFITIGNVLTVLLQLALLVVAGIAVIAVLILLIGLLLIAIVLGIYANLIIWLQVRKGFLAHLRRYGSKLKTQ